MSVNTMTFEQSAAFLTDLYEQATGKKPSIAVTDTGTFTSVGTTLLQMGYDVVSQALTQLLAKSIYSIRPYSQKFKSLNVDELKWGAVVRKINYIDSDLVDDDSIKLVDGQAIDHYKVRKPKQIQTNFYGAQNYADYVTIYTYQLDASLKDAAEMGRWLAGVLQNIADVLTQAEEAQARGILANFITGKYAEDSPNAINVLQAYYDETGVELSPTTMFSQTNYPDFIKWLYSYINTLTDFMSESISQGWMPCVRWQKKRVNVANWGNGLKTMDLMRLPRSGDRLPVSPSGSRRWKSCFKSGCRLLNSPTYRGLMDYLKVDCLENWFFSVALGCKGQVTAMMVT